MVVAGYAGDEGRDYERKIRKTVKEKKIRAVFIGRYVNSKRKVITLNGKDGRPKHRRVYTLWDCFVNADFVTYPTKIEGFGNQFVESVYFRKPVIMIPYPVYKRDIAPLGFESIFISDEGDGKAIKRVKELIEKPQEIKKMTEKNFALGEKYFSYEWVERELNRIFKDMGLSS